MHLLHSRNPWSYRLDFNMMVDFCIWVLQIDGLHASPFDQHPDGDGSLRAAGLTGEDWRSWLQSVINLQDDQQQRLSQRALADPLNPPKDLSSLFLPETHHPPSAWNDNDAVRNRLAELWEHYGPISNQRKKREMGMSRALHKEERQSGTRLYDELRPYHARIPPLTIYLVSYEQPLDYVIPPATLMMTMQECQPEAQEFRERVLAAATELAARKPQQRKQSLYIRMPEHGGQPVAAYRRYPRKSIPPAPPWQAIPWLEDAARQLIFDRLGDERSHYGIVDLNTVQFLREKNIPGWRLYEVTFQETDGEQHRMNWILKQDEDGSWRFHSASTTGDAQNQWFNFFAPVHDHPLIFLSVGWAGHANNQYELIAHGDIIDNGFHVTRVRLVTDAGQVFEDTVDHGLVFFAWEQEQEVQLPMQAELYNDEGKLVWRQTVPDQGLPPLKRKRR